jgi:hypothetical protein
MPERRSASESFDSLKSAPRILNEPVTCRNSSLSQTGTPAIAERAGENSIGVRRMRPLRNAIASSTRSSLNIIRPVGHFAGRSEPDSHENSDASIEVAAVNA